MVKARVEKENLRHIALMAREAMNRRGAELSPVDGARLWIWSVLHFDDERIRRNAKRPFRSISAMNGTLRDHWREAVAPGDTVVYPGTSAADATSSVAGSRRCEHLPGRKVVVLGNHDFTRFRWRERPLGADVSVMTLVIHTDPPLLVTHVPLVVVPDGCVNVHGHHHDFRPLETGPWINVSVEQTRYRPLDVRAPILPLAEAREERHEHGRGQPADEPSLAACFQHYAIIRRRAFEIRCDRRTIHVGFVLVVLMSSTRTPGRRRRPGAAP